MSPLALSALVTLLGLVLLLVGVVHVHLIIARLCSPWRWRVLLWLLCSFLVGYLAYVVVLFRAPGGLSHLLVSVIFAGGGAFVALITNFSLRTVRDLSELSTLRVQSVTDDLTGLHNRRYAEQRLAEELSRARRYGRPFALLMLDVDYFKRVNDGWGHAAGDRVLRAIGRLVRKELRTCDVCSRWGGEELLMILPETTPLQAVVAAERVRGAIRARVADEAFQGADGGQGPGPITVSVGVSGFRLDVSETWKDLVDEADQALYQAKAAGRDRVQSFVIEGRGPDRPAMEAHRAPLAPSGRALAT